MNLSPYPLLNGDESVRLPGLDNHAMGTISEDLVRQFNEDNNEEDGEHWTHRDAVETMAKLVFLPIEEQIKPQRRPYNGLTRLGAPIPWKWNRINAELDALGNRRR